MTQITVEADPAYIDSRASAVVQAALENVPKLDEVNTFTAKQRLKGVISSYLTEFLPNAPASYTTEQKETFWYGWQFASNGGVESYDSIYPDNIAAFGWNIDGTVHNEPRMVWHFESAFRNSIGAPDLFEQNLDYVLQDGSLFRQITIAGPRLSGANARDAVGITLWGNIFSVGSYDNAATSNPQVLFDFRGSGDKVITIANDGSENTYINLRSRNKAVIRQWIGGTDYVGLPHIKAMNWGIGDEWSTTFGTPVVGVISPNANYKASLRVDNGEGSIYLNGPSNRIAFRASSGSVNYVETNGETQFRDSANSVWIRYNTTDGLRLATSAGKLGFFQAGTTAAKQTVSGSRSGNAALESLLTALANYGLITNSTSA